MKTMSKGLLLDTHIILWFGTDPDKLSKKCTQHINRNVESHNIYLSAISLWEIGYLVKKKKIKINSEIFVFWNFILKHLNAKELSITCKDSEVFHQLDESTHEDPGDRFLISQAINNQLSLVSSDEKILANKTAGLLTYSALKQ